MSADPTFVGKFVGISKRSETGLKPSETVGMQLYPLILHLHGNLWTSQREFHRITNVRSHIMKCIYHIQTQETV